VQVPLGQVFVPFVAVHTVPHVPQFVAVFSDASQPFDTSVSQFPNPAVHAIEHSPDPQLGVPLLLLQTTPHAPQFDALFCVPISHPSGDSPLQFPKPAVHAPSTHEPEAHDSAAFARSHTAPHAPQLPRVARLVSHPLVALPSQFAKPALHVPIWQAPLKHVAPALAKAQTVPHAPQFVALVFVFVSQPSAAPPVQLPKPTAQDTEHTDAVQVGVALTVEHAAAHAPQFAALVVVFVSQPSATIPLQLPKPTVQVPSAQVPAAQVSVLFARSQTTPHAPQSVSVRMFFSQPLLGLPSQLAKPTAHVGTHVPAVHTFVPFTAAHAEPHALQLAALVFRLDSQPFAATASQLPKPALQAPRTQAPAVQLAPAFANVQVVPHAPQLVTVAFRFVSQPFAPLPSQSPQPALQLGTHAPVVQAVVPCAFAQAFPQDPQLATVVFRFVSQPSDAIPLQLPKPTLQAPRVQTPPGQVSAALARLQTTPQPPQSVSVVVLFSQPLEAMPSQLAKPALQAGTQLPDGQLVVPLPFVQVEPQAPQFVVVFSDASQAVETRRSQLPKPGAQTMLHAPSAQLAVPLVELHAAPQAPQLVTVVPRFVSHPFAGSRSQSAKPAVQAPSVQTPATHDSAAFARLQSAPQAPQFGRLVFRFVSQPSPGIPLQSPSPALQTEMPQTPAMQFGVPPTAGHTLPHAPQFETVVWVFTSHPFAAVPSQFAKPTVQAPSVQLPDAHDSAAFARSHTAPQAPQFVREVRRVSQPLEAMLSQLA
jgi:hypothetical protein